MAVYPKIQQGYFHLTGHGWQRQSQVAPLPAGCVETWRFESEQPNADAKERICLTRIWARPDVSDGMIEALHQRFGEPLMPSPVRNITLECDV